MKAKLTKVLSLVLVVIMALSLMTGCSTSSSGKGTKTQDGNKDLFKAETFKKMKNSAVLINVARGGIINEADLDEALSNGEIAGAGLDSMLGEPVSKDSPLFKHENLVVTPHMAWYSEEAASELKRKVAEESVRFSNGEAIHYPINKLA